MALPPIISNSPIFKLFSADKATRPATPANAGEKGSAGAASDTVSLSDAALEKLDAIRDESKARETAGAIRRALEDNPEATLGYREDV